MNYYVEASKFFLINPLPNYWDDSGFEDRLGEYVSQNARIPYAGWDYKMILDEIEELASSFSNVVRTNAFLMDRRIRSQRRDRKLVERVAQHFTKIVNETDWQKIVNKVGGNENV